jgi:hypothetical protein
MGDRYQKISEYNAANPGSRMNRILVVLDELNELVERAPEQVRKKIMEKIESF